MAKGSYIPLTVDRLDAGRFNRALNEALQKAAAELEAYEKATGDLQGKVQVGVKISFARAKGSEEFFDISYELQTKTPARKKGAMVRGGRGQLLVPLHPEDDELNEHGQQMLPLYDRFGHRTGEQVDPQTGETIGPDTDEEAPAGRIG